MRLSAGVFVFSICTDQAVDCIVGVKDCACGAIEVCAVSLHVRVLTEGTGTAKVTKHEGVDLVIHEGCTVCFINVQHRNRKQRDEKEEYSQIEQQVKI